MGGNSATGQLYRVMVEIKYSALCTVYIMRNIDRENGKQKSKYMEIIPFFAKYICKLC